MSFSILFLKFVYSFLAMPEWHAQAFALLVGKHRLSLLAVRWSGPPMWCTGLIVVASLAAELGGGTQA